MPEVVLTKRIGWSTLSKDNIEVAYDEEVLCNKRTGEFLIKTTEGDAMSYQYFSRLRGHEHRVEKYARDNGMITRKGYIADMYEVSVDKSDTETLILPDVIGLNQNYIINPVDLPTNVTRVIVSADMDPIIVNQDAVAADLHTGVDATVEFVCYDDSDTIITTITKTVPLFNMVTNVIDIDTPTPVTRVALTSLSFTRNDTDTDTLRYILHSVFILTESVTTNE